MNMPSVDKRFVGARLSLEAVAMARQIAEQRGVSLSSLLEEILANELRNRVQLNEKYRKWMDEEKKKNINKRG